MSSFPRSWEICQDGKVPLEHAEKLEKELQDCYATIHALRTSLSALLAIMTQSPEIQKAKDLL